MDMCASACDKYAEGDLGGYGIRGRERGVREFREEWREDRMFARAHIGTRLKYTY